MFDVNIFKNELKKEKEVEEIILFYIFFFHLKKK